MGWIGKTLIGTAAVLGIGYASLAYITREPDRPVVALPVSGKLLLNGVTIVNPRDGSLSPDMSVLIDKGQIVQVDSNNPAPEDASVQRIEADGKFLVPGYNDMHAHPLGTEDPSGGLALMLANGITGFRQMSGTDAILAERRESRLPLTQYAPAVLAMPGALLTPLNASKADQARKTVRHEKAAGADFIKAAFISRDVLFAALDEAQKSGIPVAGHVPAGTSILEAAQKGMRAVEHLGPANGLIIACSSQSETILADLRATTETPVMPEINSKIVEKLAGWALQKMVVNPVANDHEAGGVVPMQKAMASFDEARCRQTMQGLKAAGNWQVPTLIRLKTIYLADDPSFAANENLKYVSPETIDTWRDVTEKFLETYPASDRAIMKRGYAFSLKLVKMLDEEGVSMLAGSDASGSGWEVPGIALHREFEELAKAGLTPLRVLQMTTSDASDFLGRQKTMGGIQPGMQADLVLLDADPTQSVVNLHKIAGVVRAGFYHSRSDLEKLKARVAAGKGNLQ